MNALYSFFRRLPHPVKVPEYLWRLVMVSTVVAVVIIGAAVSLRLHSFGKNAARLSHSYGVLDTITELLHQLGTEEMSEREFLVTKDATLLMSQDELGKNLLPLIGKLREQTVDDPSQSNKLSVLSALVDKKLEEADVNYKNTRAASLQAAAGAFRDGNDKKIYENLYSTLHDMQGQEEELLNVRLKDFEDTRRGSKWLIQVVVGIVTGLILFLLYIEATIRKSRRSLIHSTKVIKQKEEEFKTIANAIPQIIWVTSADGTIEYLNERWYEYTGASPSDMKPPSLHHYLHPDDYEKTVALREKSLKSGETYEAEYRLKSAATGAYRWFIARALPLFKEDGTMVRWLGTSTDIHDQKLLAEEKEHLLQGERLARDEAEHANNVKNQYITTLSHELRGALNAILGWTQILLTKPDDAQLVRRGISVINKNARIQSQLVSDLFDINRINAGKFTVSFEQVNLSELVAMTADTVLPACAEKNIQLITTIEPHMQDVPSEASRISQVLMNVLNNSVKFTPSGGTITLSLSAEKDSAVISVHDTGAGIEPSMLERIFDQYNQGTCSPADKQGGMGLGLTLARSIVNMLGGSIKAMSDGIGCGSTFRITLPLEPQEGITVFPRKNNRGANRIIDRSITGISVLVVEDQEDAREAIVRILSEQGAVVATASNGIEGLNKLKEMIPQVVVSDISMPDMDGYAFARELKRRYPSLPAIALTALVRDEDKQRALTSGFRLQLSKPTDIPSLLLAIKTLAENSRPDISSPTT